MPSPIKRILPLAIVLGLAVAAGVFLANYLRNRSDPLPPPQDNRQVFSELSMLGEMPDWSKLEVFQDTISRADFENLLTTVFTTGSGWLRFMEIDDAGVRIRTAADPESEGFFLRFSTPTTDKIVPRHWKTAAELPVAALGKPLEGLRVAIDPGHIGGEWAQLEERWLKPDDGLAVCEGEMTLLVANLLKPRLEALGATVSLVRLRNDPVTALRPESLVDTATKAADPAATPEDLKKLSERLFYRTAEIHARAKLVNESLKPDLVLCLHFNAEAWGPPSHPTLVECNHLHLLLNGAYTDQEVALEDQRFYLLEKLLSRTHEEEARIAITVADSFATASGLPPYTYPAGSLNVRSVKDHPYLWARNLLANRLYNCPVIYMEPYVMNSTIDFPRLQAGDFDGTREINGRMQSSIFREYADYLTKGLALYYGSHRKTAP